MKRLIVNSLVHACWALDHLPRVYRWQGKWCAGFGCWGCDAGLANLSLRLDDRWETGVWT